MPPFRGGVRDPGRAGVLYLLKSELSLTAINRTTDTEHLTPQTFYKVSMGDNLAALVDAAGAFRIVSLIEGEGNHFAGAGSQRIDPKPICLNLPVGATVCGSFLFPSRTQGSPHRL